MHSIILSSAIIDKTGVTFKGGEPRTFEQWGAVPGETVRVFALSIELNGLPSNFDFELFCVIFDANSGEYLLEGTAEHLRPRVVIHYYRAIGGNCSFVCKGVRGAKGTPGAKGADAEPEGLTDGKKPFPVAGGDGGNGGWGQQGGQGGTAIVYTKSSDKVSVSAPGGDGGAPGDPGIGGKGIAGGGTGRHGLPGGIGEIGPAGEARVEILPNIEAFKVHLQKSMSNEDYVAWFSHYIRVCEYRYRKDGDASGDGRTWLGLAIKTCVDQGVLTHAGNLLTTIALGNTASGLSREMDVTPDVAFAAKDNVALQGQINAMLVFANQQASNWTNADTAAVEVNQHRHELKERADILLRRIDVSVIEEQVTGKRNEAANQRIQGIRSEMATIQKALGETKDPFNLQNFITLVKMAVSIATGVGGIVAVGEGYAWLDTISKQQGSAVEIVKDIIDRAEAGEKDAKKLIKGFNDIADAGKTVLSIGQVLKELGILEQDAPSDDTKRLAALGRDLAVAMYDAGASSLDVTRAKAATAVVRQEYAYAENDIAEVDAILASINMKKATAVGFLNAYLAIVRRIGDTLSERLFLTMRARETYLGLDTREIVSFSIGRIDPEHEAVLKMDPVSLANEYTHSGTAEGLRIIDWNGVYNEMFRVPGLDFNMAQGHVLLDPTTHPDILAAFARAGTEDDAVEFEILIPEQSGVFEARIDSGASVVLHGAKLKGGTEGAVLRLQHTGSCALRRRPSGKDMVGDVKRMHLSPHALDLGCKQVDDGVVAEVSGTWRPEDIPPLSIWGRPIMGLWRLWSQEIDARWDLSGLRAVEVTIHGNGLTASSGTSGQVKLTGIKLDLGKLLVKAVRPRIRITLPQP
ncbi:MAG: hypothetical protein V7642_7021 [Burkholderiales bacterium]|jgi:hypothetical protein